MGFVVVIFTLENKLRNVAYRRPASSCELYPDTLLLHVRVRFAVNNRSSSLIESVVCTSYKIFKISGLRTLYYSFTGTTIVSIKNLQLSIR